MDRTKNQVIAERADLIAQEQTSFGDVVHPYVASCRRSSCSR